MIGKFNLIPWDPESYLVAADYAEEQGFLLSNAIRKKILPLNYGLSTISRTDCSGCPIINIINYEGSADGVNGIGWGWAADR